MNQIEAQLIHYFNTYTIDVKDKQYILDIEVLDIAEMIANAADL